LYPWNGIGKNLLIYSLLIVVEPLHNQQNKQDNHPMKVLDKETRALDRERLADKKT
jgi:hypothetical protein